MPVVYRQKPLLIARALRVGIASASVVGILVAKQHGDPGEPGAATGTGTVEVRSDSKPAELFELNFDPPEPIRSSDGPVDAEKVPTVPNEVVPDSFPRAPAGWLEGQIALARRGFSAGPIDGVFGAKTKAALEAFQESEGIPVSGWLDPNVAARLSIESPPLRNYTVTAGDLDRLQPLEETWLGRSQQNALDYESILELVAERSRASHNLVKRLNPEIDWDNVQPGTVVSVPAVDRPVLSGRAAHLHVRLADRVLQARDIEGRIVAHFPVSIAQKIEKRPVGELRVTVVIPDPDYTFDPVNFPESDEARELNRRLMIRPGPNNPVGVAWIGLDRPGYGIHGTPHPERVGRTESHGCFRLANWDARTLLEIAWVGLPVFVDP